MGRATRSTSTVTTTVTNANVFFQTESVTTTVTSDTTTTDEAFIQTYSDTDDDQPTSTSSQPQSATAQPSATSTGGSSSSSNSHDIGQPHSLVYDFTATVTIVQFPSPIPYPIKDYRPLYSALSDGTLLTPVYSADLWAANLRLFAVGALLAVFLHTSYIAFDFLRRCRAKDKTLFYLLLVSQLLGPICFSVQLVGWFDLTANCTIIHITAMLSIGLSFSIMITGILGIKVYRVFNRAKFVLFVMAGLQLGALMPFLLDLFNLVALRGLNGSCGVPFGLNHLPASGLHRL